MAVRKSGYEEEDLIEVVYEKTRRYRDYLLTQRPLVSEIDSLRTLIGLGMATRYKELNVIVFGGACGAHYFFSRIAFGDSINLRWHVVETPKIASKATTLADERLIFFMTFKKQRVN
jgi:putative methyltransferase (TIGR04325 family)